MKDLGIAILISVAIVSIHAICITVAIYVSPMAGLVTFLAELTIVGMVLILIG